MSYRFAVVLLVLGRCFASSLHAAEPAAAEPTQPGTVRLVVPPVMPAVVGHECNLYFDNVALVVNPANWVFDVEASRGSQQVERWTWTPSEKDVGDHAIALKVFNQENQLVATARTTVRVVADDAKRDQPLTVLCIGDSLTHASAYTQRLLDRSAAPNQPKISLIGTHWVGDEGPNRHEGYGGWTARRFATHFAEIARTGPNQQRGSPFLFKGEDDKPTLDFARYCREVSGGKHPDVATIFLGPNDIFRCTDETIEAGIDDMLEHLDQLVAMLRKQNDVTQIGLMVAVPPAATQDAFGANYGSGSTRWQYKRNQHRLVERIYEKYGNRQSERIHLVPTHVNLDCQNNYPAAAVPANSTNETKVTRLNNGVHPAKSGYQQIGDTLYAWLKGL